MVNRFVYFTPLWERPFMDKSDGEGRKEIPVSYVYRAPPSATWSPSLQDEISKSLEQAEWAMVDTHFEGRHGNWVFKAFGSGMDKTRNCEVMASNKGTVIRLPPNMAERGFQLAKEKVRDVRPS